MVIENERSALSIIERIGKRKGEVDRGYGNLSKATEHAEGGDALARLEA